MAKNVGDLGKLFVAKGFKKGPKVKKIAQSGHTGLVKLKPLLVVSDKERDYHSTLTAKVAPSVKYFIRFYFSSLMLEKESLFTENSQTEVGFPDSRYQLNKTDLFNDLESIGD